MRWVTRMHRTSRRCMALCDDIEYQLSIALLCISLSRTLGGDAELEHRFLRAILTSWQLVEELHWVLLRLVHVRDAELARHRASDLIGYHSMLVPSMARRNWRAVRVLITPHHMDRWMNILWPLN